MSWELIERLGQRFPEIEPFPRAGEPAKSPGGAGGTSRAHSAAGRGRAGRAAHSPSAET